MITSILGLYIPQGPVLQQALFYSKEGTGVEEQNAQKSDYFLDITDEVCPMTFVKTKLMIEKMESGAVLDVRLKGSEPLQNVPRSVIEMGHRVLSCTLQENGAHLLRILKA